MVIRLPIKETISVEEGRHTFKIVSVTERTEPYHYIDVHYELDCGVVIKNGYPAVISENSALGKLLKQTNVAFEIGENVDVDDVLIGKSGSLITMNEETKKGTYARVVPGSERFEGKPSPLSPFFAFLATFGLFLTMFLEGF